MRSVGRIGLLVVLMSAGCFGARSVGSKSYFVLGRGAPVSDDFRTIDGLLRVRDMDADAVYEKFQIVRRRSPYELGYSRQNLWAVKPEAMVSDILAKRFADARVFAAVTRELGDVRPTYILSGELHAIEIYDSRDVWFAHLALTLRVSRFEDGARVLQFKFDERKHVPARTHEQAVRALSELLADASDYLLTQLEATSLPRLSAAPARRRAVFRGRARGPVRTGTVSRARKGAEAPGDGPDEVYYVPEVSAGRR